jgi:hypothetical protein
MPQVTDGLGAALCKEMQEEPGKVRGLTVGRMARGTMQLTLQSNIAARKQFLSLNGLPLICNVSQHPQQQNCTSCIVHCSLYLDT